MSADSVHVKQMSILFVLLYLQLEPDLIITSLLHWEIKSLFSHKSSSIKQTKMYVSTTSHFRNTENQKTWKICLNDLAYAFSMNSLSLDFPKVSVKKPTVQKKLPKKLNIPIKLVLLWNSWESFWTSLSDHQRDLGYCTVLLKLSMFLYVDIDPSPILRTLQVLQEDLA